MRIAGIDFPEGLLDVLRGGNLVVFAGAGVSMGPPANLPDFKALGTEIAAGAGKEVGHNEPTDRFLGRLEQEGVKVRERAEQILLGCDTKPTPLHRDLLRLSKGASCVRIVTTNYDALFEQAAETDCDSMLQAYQAPALPLGRDFVGIVHVHGAVGHPRGMVLTDKDVGRAYLTEGWARRFLVEVFESFTVLFVGYSHDDVIMKYLTRALPAGKTQPRFALTDESEKDGWERLGIKPISYPMDSSGDHAALDEGIYRLARIVQRNILDWQIEIAELARNGPSLDEEEMGVMAEALSDLTKMQFFTNSATPPEWIQWLDARGYLNALFATEALGNRDMALGHWLAQTFACEHANWLFVLIAKRPSLRLNPAFWHQLVIAVGLNKKQDVSSGDLSRWVIVLLATVPFDQPAVIQHGLAWLAERCGEAGLGEEVVKIFGCMAATPLQLSQGSRWPRAGDTETRPGANSIPVCSHHDLNTVWEKCLKPRLEAVAESLLSTALDGLFPEAVALAAKMPKMELEHSAALVYLAESDLWQKQPRASAEFLVCLDAYLPQWAWVNSYEMILHLLQENLPEQLKSKLREVVAKNNLQTRSVQE